MRLFVSVDLPDDLTDDVAAVQERFADASGLSFTDPAQAHVTLQFLGDVTPGRRDELAAALQSAVDAAALDPFTVDYGGIGVFPGLDYVRVLWLGVRDGHGDGELAALHEHVERETTALGFDPDDHAFTPHVTIARMEHAGGKELVQELVQEYDPDVGTQTVDALSLTESELGSDGPTYSTVERVSL
jgi:2'-5' RNA ligase